MTRRRILEARQSFFIQIKKNTWPKLQENQDRQHALKSLKIRIKEEEDTKTTNIGTPQDELCAMSPIDSIRES